MQSAIKSLITAEITRAGVTKQARSDPYSSLDCYASPNTNIIQNIVDKILILFTGTAYSATQPYKACSICRNPYIIGDFIYLDLLNTCPLLFGAVLGGCQVSLERNKNCCSTCIKISSLWFAKHIIMNPNSLAAFYFDLNYNHGILNGVEEYDRIITIVYVNI